MEIVEKTLSVLQPYAWPITVLIIVMLLKKDIKQLLQRIKAYKGPAGSIDFGISSADRVKEHPTELKSNVATVQANWGKIGNIYWLAHDLMWTIDTALRGAPGSIITRGLSQSLHHLKELNLSNNTYESKLQKLLTKAESKLETDWTPDERVAFAIDLLGIRDELGQLISKQQPDFKP